MHYRSIIPFMSPPLIVMSYVLADFSLVFETTGDIGTDGKEMRQSVVGRSQFIGLLNWLKTMVETKA